MYTLKKHLSIRCRVFLEKPCVHGIWQETLHALELPDAKSSTSNSPKSRGLGFGFWRLAASYPGMDGLCEKEQLPHPLPNSQVLGVKVNHAVAQ